MSKKRKTKHAPQSTQNQSQSAQPGEPKIPWIKLVTEIEPLCAIPVLPRFQADLPNCTGNCQDPDSKKWLGEQIWPLPEGEETRKRRLEICSCRRPGSVECVSHHVTEESNRLKTELGPAFEVWKFDQMGEEAYRAAWSPREEKKFEAMVKRNLSEDHSRVESSWNSFRNKDRKSLVNYYFNVYIPRKISQLTRSACTEVETDDDVPSNSENLESEELEPNNNSNSKKKGTKSVTAKDERNKSKESSSSKSQKKSANYAGKNKYLAGRR